MGNRPASLRRRAGQPGGLGALDPELAGPRLPGCWSRNQRRLDCNDTVNSTDLRLRTGPRTEPAAARQFQEVAEDAWWRPPAATARRALRRHLIPTFRVRCASGRTAASISPRPAPPSGAKPAATAAGAPTRLHYTCHGLAATGLRHALELPRDARRAEPLPCRRSGSRRSAGGASGPSAPPISTTAAMDQGRHGNLMHPCLKNQLRLRPPRPVVGRALPIQDGWLVHEERIRFPRLAGTVAIQQRRPRPAVGATAPAPEPGRALPPAFCASTGWRLAERAASDDEQLLDLLGALEDVEDLQVRAPLLQQLILSA